jgi:hypothetical protein
MDDEVTLNAGRTHIRRSAAGNIAIDDGNPLGANYQGAIVIERADIPTLSRLFCEAPEDAALLNAARAFVGIIVDANEPKALLLRALDALGRETALRRRIVELDGLLAHRDVRIEALEAAVQHPASTEDYASVTAGSIVIQTEQRQRIVALERQLKLVRDVVEEAHRTHHFVGAHAVNDLLIALENVLGAKETA